MAVQDSDLGRWIDDARHHINDELDRAVQPLGTPPPILHQAMRHSLLAPAKRLRGVLVLLVAELFRANREAASGPACAVELVHASSLILDDLPCMDNASLRRGRPALHREVGEANAILAAVALLTQGFGLLQSWPALRDRGRRRCSTILAEAIGAQGLIGGQVVDLQSTGRAIELEQLEYIHSHKTGALFIASAALGAVVGGARPRDEQALRRYAKNLGLAFQITDDLLDYSGTPEVTGKDAGLDRDKTTFVDLCGIDGARKLVDELIDAAVGTIEPLGRRGARLAALAELVRERDR